MVADETTLRLRSLYRGGFGLDTAAGRAGVDVAEARRRLSETGSDLTGEPTDEGLAGLGPGGDRHPRTELRRRYVTEGLAVADIARRLDDSTTTVHRNLDRHRIGRRTPKPIPKQHLVDLYVNQGSASGPPPKFSAVRPGGSAATWNAGGSRSANRGGRRGPRNWSGQERAETLRGQDQATLHAGDRLEAVMGVERRRVVVEASTTTNRPHKSRAPAAARNRALACGWEPSRRSCRLGDSARRAIR